MTLALVTDGSCDLPPTLAAALRVTVVPHHVIWGQQSYTEGINLTQEQFYERLVRDPLLPKTSQASPGEFADGYRRARDQANADTVICVTLSKDLSGAYHSAMTARSLVDFPVEVIDSRSA